MSEYGCVLPPYWDNKPVAILGNGPSLAGFDLSRLRDRFHVLAVKNHIFDLPWAAAGFGLDWPRYREWHPRFEHITLPVYWAVPRLYLMPEPQPRCVTLLKRIDEPPGLSDDVGTVYAGGTSGFGALNLAWLKQAKQIVLLGFDYRPTNKRWHADAKHYRETRGQDDLTWQKWAENFNKIGDKIKQSGVEVINACPASRLTAFPRMTIDNALHHLDRVRPARGGSICGDAGQRQAETNATRPSL